MNRKRNNEDNSADPVPQSKRDGDVYFLYCCNRVKIGWSRNNPQRRVLIDIAPLLPAPAHLIGCVRASVHSESELHARFAADRIHHEWFDLSPDLRSFLCEDERREDRLEMAEDTYRDFIEDEYHRIFKGEPNDNPPGQPGRPALRPVPNHDGSEGPREVLAIEPPSRVA